ncbi:hypothetical protein M1P56_34965 (plasmid) [Streptomyces sp. HU2014]|uniref:hypothetical protein n=1 Tax=Streptomyces sp. HU2014 TaxID=2939414 RepID=UPI00200C614C|nr:hypothetical protein [Streptomyces sp. HU2014]UQI49721.1 hypothetical protein M1P56_34965 [Streptomyces sp. HU2014]
MTRFLAALADDRGDDRLGPRLARFRVGRQDLVPGPHLLDLLVRDNATGRLVTHHGVPNADTGGIDPWSLANGSTSIHSATAWQNTNRPLLAMPGDADNDGTTDLWATTTVDTGTLLHYPTRNGTHGSPVLVGTGGWKGIKALA